VSPADIRNVVISHVHDDHIGGTVAADGAPTFPNARYLIPAADWSWQKSAAEAEPGGEDEAIFSQLLAPLEAAGVVDLVSGDGSLGAGVTYSHAPGHTPGHQIMRVTDGQEGLALTADVFNHPVQVGHPEWASGSDNDPALGVETRTRILNDLAAETAMLVAPTHLAEPFGRIVAGPRGNEWRPEGL
jgi:glyoxylase-like metal-dependent hydrolase (beta-lactamase superfamily II)